MYRRHAGDQFFHRRLVYSPWTVDPAPFLPDSQARLGALCAVLDPLVDTSPVRR